MNARSVATAVLALVVITGLAFLGVAVYNAGVTQGLVESGQVAVAPAGYVGPYVGGYGYGWGHGFSFFGFLGTLFFIFLLIALVRAAFGRGRRWGGPGGWDGHRGWGGPGDPRRDHWEARVRDYHEELHRTAGDRGGPDTRPASTDRGADGEPPA